MQAAGLGIAAETPQQSEELQQEPGPKLRRRESPLNHFLSTILFFTKLQI